jgi:hypothetical protein
MNTEETGRTQDAPLKLTGWWAKVPPDTARGPAHRAPRAAHCYGRSPRPVKRDPLGAKIARIRKGRKEREAAIKRILARRKAR